MFLCFYVMFFFFLGSSFIPEKTGTMFIMCSCLSMAGVSAEVQLCNYHVGMFSLDTCRRSSSQLLYVIIDLFSIKNLTD